VYVNNNEQPARRFARHAPGNVSALLPAQRRQEILRAVRSGTAHVTDLAESFGVSEMTVRRDLRTLAREGKLERVHGGAIETSVERPFAQIEVERFDGKDRIGAAAAALIEDGQTVMVDIGTSTLQMARHLHGRRLTVVTTSLAVLEELLPDPGIELVLPGGIVRRNYRSLVGMVAEDSLRQLKADIVFLGTSAIDPELGVWDTTMVEVPIKRLMIAAADRVVLLADNAKFSMSGMVRVCGPESLDHIVTDAPPPAWCQSVVEAAGIEVTVA
jgi:DeoR/GlpR family transcriptional regulator of sugar metabolism